MESSATNEVVTYTITESNNEEPSKEGEEAKTTSKHAELRAKDQIIGTIETSSNTGASIKFTENEHGMHATMNTNGVHRYVLIAALFLDFLSHRITT